MIQIKKITELTGHSGAVYALEQAETENCFYSGSGDKIVTKWNLDTLSSEKFAAQLPGIVYSLCYVAEKNSPQRIRPMADILLAGTSEGKIHVIDLAEKKEIKILQNHMQPVFDIQYSSQNKLILSAGGDGMLSLLSAEDFSAIKIIKLCNEKLRAIDIYEDQAAVACGDGMIRIIDLKIYSEGVPSGKVTNEFQAHKDSVYSVKFSPDGKYLLSGGKDAHLNKWKMPARMNRSDGENGKWEMGKSIPAHNFAIYSIVFSPDGKYFATASRDKTIKIWDATTFELLTRINKENFDGHINSVNKLLWSEHKNFLISTSDDRKIIIWEITK